MNKLCILVATTIAGYAGWMVSDTFGLGFGWSFLLSSIGSLFGVWLGWKVAQKLQ